MRSLEISRLTELSRERRTPAKRHSWLWCLTLLFLCCKSAPQEPSSDLDPVVAGKHLTAWLHDLHTDERGLLKDGPAKRAVQELGERALPTLTNMFACGYGKGGVQDGMTDEFRARFERQGQAMLGFVAVGPRAVPSIIESLACDETAIFAQVALSRIGVPAIEPLKKGLHHTNATIRARTAYIIGVFRSRATTCANELINVLRDPSWEVRDAALVALTRIDADPAMLVSAFSPLLDDPNPTLRKAAAYAIRDLGSAGRPALDSLKRLARETDPLIREAAEAAIRGVLEKTEPSAKRP